MDFLTPLCQTRSPRALDLTFLQCALLNLDLFIQRRQFLQIAWKHEKSDWNFSLIRLSICVLLAKLPSLIPPNELCTQDITLAHNAFQLLKPLDRIGWIGLLKSLENLSFRSCCLKKNEESKLTKDLRWSGVYFCPAKVFAPWAGLAVLAQLLEWCFPAFSTGLAWVENWNWPLTSATKTAPLEEPWSLSGLRVMKCYQWLALQRIIPATWPTLHPTHPPKQSVFKTIPNRSHGAVSPQCWSNF